MTAVFPVGSSYASTNNFRILSNTSCWTSCKTVHIWISPRHVLVFKPQELTAAEVLSDSFPVVPILPFWRNCFVFELCCCCLGLGCRYERSPNCNTAGGTQTAWRQPSWRKGLSWGCFCLHGEHRFLSNTYCYFYTEKWKQLSTPARKS